MIWLLILILNHPILVKPNLFVQEVYPAMFVSRNACEDVGADEMKKKSVILAYCTEIKPVLVK